MNMRNGFVKPDFQKWFRYLHPFEHLLFEGIKKKSLGYVMSCLEPTRGGQTVMDPISLSKAW